MLQRGSAFGTGLSPGTQGHTLTGTRTLILVFIVFLPPIITGSWGFSVAVHLRKCPHLVPYTLRVKHIFNGCQLHMYVLRL